MEENINNNILNDHNLLVENYKYIYHHVYFSDILYNNTCVNIICLRNPVDRLISHFHFFDSVKLGYKNLIEFKKKNLNLFNSYIKFIGNLTFLKMSSFFEYIFKLNDDYVNIIKFADNIIFNKNILDKVIIILSPFNICWFDEIKTNDLIPLINTKNEKYNYSIEFKKSLLLLCEYDYHIYTYLKIKNNKVKDTEYL